MTLTNKVALVTGASRGIGRAVALKLASQGAHVALASRSREELRAVAARIQRFGRKCIVIPTDLTDKDQIAAMIDQTLRMMDTVDILVNNAGLGIFKPVVEATVEEWDLMWNVNVRGLFLCTKAVLPTMIRNQQGAIVNVASLAGKNPVPGGSGYCATKHAVLGFTKSLMMEVRKHNIRVLSVCPGSVDTPFFDNAGFEPPNRDKILHPKDVADVIISALIMPERALVSDIDIRPTHQK